MPDRRFEYPKLLAARGLPAPDADTMSALLDIVDEGVLGASNHVALALPLVVRTARRERPSARDEAHALAEFIAQTRGAGAPIVANALRWLTDGMTELAAEDASALLEQRARQWEARSRARRSGLIEKAVTALEATKSPLLFDYSSTVADVLRSLSAHKALTRLVVPESRVIDGGRRYLDALKDLKLPMLFLPDAALEYAVTKSDAVLLGAESLTNDGGVVNTIGSVLAARSARAHGVPVYGVADLFKVGPNKAAEMAPPDLRDYDFIVPDGASVRTEAPELEIVPPDLIEAILTEEGPIPPGGIGAAARRATAGGGFVHHDG